MAKEPKIWKTAAGEVVPAEIISGHDKRKEQAVNRIAKQALKASDVLRDLKSLINNEVTKVYEEHLRIKNIDHNKAKGNYTLYNFDKSWMISIKNSEIIAFDDNINVVKALLDEYIEDVTNDSSSDIRLLVQNAFRTKKGQLDKARLLSLFQYEIKHPIWQRAMDELKSSIDIQSSKMYVQVFQRDEQGEYTAIPLSLSNV